MIPKLIHQTAKTADIPAKWRAYQGQAQSLHPGWTYRLWTDEDNLAFVRAEFPDFLDTFEGLPKNIMRADVIRYLLLYRLGGLYMDLDYEMLKPFDLLDHGAVLPKEANGPGLGNAIMAASPGHPFFKRVIDDLSANPPVSTNSDDVIDATGPGLITRAYRAAPPEVTRDIHTPEPPLFQPVPPKSPRQYRAIVGGGVAYGIHHCHGSWREYGLLLRLRSRTANAVRWLLK